MATIGIMATQDATARNMEHVLFRIAQTLTAEHKVELVGSVNVSDRISSHFQVYAPDMPPTLARYLPGWPVWSRVRLMQKYIRARNPDLVMAVSSIGVNGLAVAIAGKTEGVPSVIRITSDIFRVWKTKPGWKQKARMYIRNNLLGRIAMLLADKVVLLHDIQRRYLVNGMYPDSRFFTVPQPVTFPAAPSRPECRAAICRTLNIPENAFIIGSTMRLDADKKIGLMADVIRKSCKTDPEAYFVLVGNGTRKDWLEESLRGEQRVRFVEAMPRDHLALYYQTFDKLIHMSDSEGLANVIIEALYFDTPVVATDSGAVTRGLVRHVSDDAAELTELVLRRGMTPDPLPDTLHPEENAKLWLQLIRETLGTARQAA